MGNRSNGCEMIKQADPKKNQRILLPVNVSQLLTLNEDISMIFTFSARFSSGDDYRFCV